MLSVATGIGGCGWIVYTRSVRMDVAFWKFSNNIPNYASLADAMMFLMVLNSTCTDPFYGVIGVIGVLDFSVHELNLCEY